MKRILAPALAALVLMSGCAGIPEGGPVTRVKADEGTSQSTVRYSPAGPTRNASPQQIVRGYLDAMLAYPVTTGTAASFLTPEAARSWKSSAGVRIYVKPEVSNPRASDGRGEVDVESAAIGLHVVEDAKLDRQGHFDRVNARKDFGFHLVKSRGQWRIDNPQDGFLINRKFFDDYYRPFSDYYFDRPGKRLVADPIYLPVGDQLSTALISSLLLGQGSLLGGTARTYAPNGAQLSTSVPVREDGLADVQLRDELSSLSSAAQDRLSAQLVWTLRQVPKVTGVRITGGDTVLVPGNRGVQAIDSWQEFGPRSGDGSFYGVQLGHVVKFDGRVVDPIDGPWGKDARGAVSIAVDSARIAAVGKGRSSLMIGELNSKAISSISGSNFLPPEWDDTGHVWAVDSAGGSTRIRLANGRSTRTLSIGRLDAFNVTSFALSPDGSRYAVLADVAHVSQTFVGSVLRDSDDTVTSLGPPVRVQAQDARFSAARSVSWSDDTTVAFLANDSVVGSQIFAARIDGSHVTGGTASSGALLPDVSARTLTSAGGPDPVRYVIDSANRTWLLRPGGNWERLSQKGITAITAATG